MKFSKIQFVYVNVDYLKKLNEVEPEIFFDENNEHYKEKPHKIEEKAHKIYTKQIKENKVLKYHCDYQKLEKVADEYQVRQFKSH